MTAEALIARLRERGTTLRPDGNDLVIRSASALRPEEVNLLRTHKAEILALLQAPAQLPLLPNPLRVTAYEAALRSFWLLMSQGAAVDPATALRGRDEVLRLEDDVGEPRATELRLTWEREWYRETERCPRCGEQGERHE